MIRVAVNGAEGRMGARILALAADKPDVFKIAGSFDVGSKVTATALADCDVLIDFSGPEGTRMCVEEALKAKKALVIGSTGLDEALLEKIKAASTQIAVVRSSNMSVGVNLAVKLAEEAAAKLGPDFDIEITEAHHRHKKDAPSGTALMLAEAIARVKKWDLKKVLSFRKDAKASKDRPSEEIGMQVIRAGEIVGDHTVLFAGPSETIEITHRAQSRDAFARGALVAASFVSGKKNGLFTMADVLR